MRSNFFKLFGVLLVGLLFTLFARSSVQAQIVGISCDPTTYQRTYTCTFNQPHKGWTTITDCIDGVVGYPANGSAQGCPQWEYCEDGATSTNLNDICNPTPTVTPTPTGTPKPTATPDPNKKDGGAACIVNSTCKSDNCVWGFGICAPLDNGTWCREDTDCKSGYCDTVGVNECAPNPNQICTPGESRYVCIHSGGASLNDVRKETCTDGTHWEIRDGYYTCNTVTSDGTACAEGNSGPTLDSICLKQPGGMFCTSDTQCESGDCVTDGITPVGFCQTLPNGYWCKENNDCQSGYCDLQGSNACTNPPTNPCVENSWEGSCGGYGTLSFRQCQNSKYIPTNESVICSTKITSSVCEGTTTNQNTKQDVINALCKVPATVEKKSANAVCERNAECASGKCINSLTDSDPGRCQAVGQGYFCHDNDNCASGLYCDDGGLLGRSSCQTKKTDGAKCSDNDECSSGDCVKRYAWGEGYCQKVPVGQWCGNDEDCASDFCDTDNKNECVAAQSGDACSPSDTDHKYRYQAEWRDQNYVQYVCSPNSETYEPIERVECPEGTFAKGGTYYSSSDSFANVSANACTRNDCRDGQFRSVCENNSTVGGYQLRLQICDEGNWINDSTLGENGYAYCDNSMVCNTSATGNPYKVGGTVAQAISGQCYLPAVTSCRSITQGECEGSNQPFKCDVFGLDKCCVDEATARAQQLHCRNFATTGTLFVATSCQANFNEGVTYTVTGTSFYDRATLRVFNDGTEIMNTNWNGAFSSQINNTTSTRIHAVVFNPYDSGTITSATVGSECGFNEDICGAGLDTDPKCRNLEVGTACTTTDNDAGLCTKVGAVCSCLKPAENLNCNPDDLSKQYRVVALNATASKFSIQVCNNRTSRYTFTKDAVCPNGGTVVGVGPYYQNNDSITDLCVGGNQATGVCVGKRSNENCPLGYNFTCLSNGSNNEYCCTTETAAQSRGYQCNNYSSNTCPMVTRVEADGAIYSYDCLFSASESWMPVDGLYCTGDKYMASCFKKRVGTDRSISFGTKCEVDGKVGWAVSSTTGMGESVRVSRDGTNIFSSTANNWKGAASGVDTVTAGIYQAQLVVGGEVVETKSSSSSCIVPSTTVSVTPVASITPGAGGVAASPSPATTITPPPNATDTPKPSPTKEPTPTSPPGCIYGTLTQCTNSGCPSEHCSQNNCRGGAYRCTYVALPTATPTPEPTRNPRCNDYRNLRDCQDDPTCETCTSAGCDGSGSRCTVHTDCEYLNLGSCTGDTNCRTCSSNGCSNGRVRCTLYYATPTVTPTNVPVFTPTQKPRATATPTPTPVLKDCADQGTGAWCANSASSGDNICPTSGGYQKVWGTNCDGGGTKGQVCCVPASSGKQCPWCHDPNSGAVLPAGLIPDPDNNYLCDNNKVCYKSAGGTADCANKEKQVRFYAWDSNSNSCNLLIGDNRVDCNAQVNSPSNACRTEVGECYCKNNNGGGGGGGGAEFSCANSQTTLNLDQQTITLGQAVAVSGTYKPEEQYWQTMLNNIYKVQGKPLGIKVLDAGQQKLYLSEEENNAVVANEAQKTYSFQGSYVPTSIGQHSIQAAGRLWNGLGAELYCESAGKVVNVVAEPKVWVDQYWTKSGAYSPQADFDGNKQIDFNDYYKYWQLSGNN